MSRIDRYGVIGNPVDHSLSPLIHAAFAKETQQNIQYEKILAPLDGFQEIVTKFHAEGGVGLNVTVPFKEEAFRLCTDLTQRAKAARAVNTLYFGVNGSIFGDNTDGIGLVHDLKINHGIALIGQRILLLGAGGAARGALAQLCQEQPVEIHIANRTMSKSEHLLAEFGGICPVKISSYENLLNKTFNLIINATSASLNHAELPLPAGIIANEGCCYDMVYGDELTPFLHWAKANHAKFYLDGLGMLVEQAAEAFYIWRGVRPNTRRVIDMLRKKI